MKRKILMTILILCLTNIVFSQKKYTIVSKSINENIEWLLNFKNLDISVVKKNRNPYKKVEILINNKSYGITNDYGKKTIQISKTGNIKFKFNKGSKQFTKVINFSQDSIYTIILMLNKPEYTTFSIVSKPLETPVYEKIKESKDISLLYAFIFRFPKGKYVNQCKKNFDNILFADAKNTNTMQAYKTYIDKSPYDFYKLDAELLAYSLAKHKNTKYAYREYINLFPKCNHASDASLRINKIDKQIAQEEEYRIYKNAINSNVADCNTYISKYPNGKYINQIKKHKNLIITGEIVPVNLKKVNSGTTTKYINKREDEDFEKVVTSTDCIIYLNRYPKSVYSETIESRYKYRLEYEGIIERPKKVKYSNDIFGLLAKSIDNGVEKIAPFLKVAQSVIKEAYSYIPPETYEYDESKSECGYKKHEFKSTLGNKEVTMYEIKCKQWGNLSFTLFYWSGGEIDNGLWHTQIGDESGYYLYEWGAMDDTYDFKGKSLQEAIQNTCMCDK